MTVQPTIAATAAGVVLRLRVQPRASRDEVAGVAGEVIRIRLRAPPVDGAANEALVCFLASRLQVSRSALELVSGHTGRLKLVAVSGMTVELATERLLSCPGEQSG